MKLGFIGCGKMATQHAEVAKALGAEITAVCATRNSQNIADFQKRFQPKHRYIDAMDLIQAGHCDALVVCTTWQATEAIAERVVAEKIPALLEKPVSQTSAHAQKLLELAGANHHAYLIGYNRRFYQGIQKLKTTIMNQPLRSIDLEVSDTASSWHKQFPQEKDCFPGLTNFYTAHWIDLLLYLVGDIKILSKISNHSAAVANLSVSVLAASTKWGCPITIRENYDSPQTLRLSATIGPETWMFHPLEQLNIYDSLIKYTDPKGSNTYRPRIKESIKEESPEGFKLGLREQMQEFFQLVKSPINSKQRIGCTLAEHLQLLKTLEAIDFS